MIMIRNILKPLPSSISQIHRMMQYVIGTVLILGSWQHYTVQLSALIFLIAMILYQSLILLLNLKTDIFSNIKLTLAVVFVDGIVTGLLIKFCGLQHALSIGIGCLFVLVHVKAISTNSLAAILGVSASIYTANFTSFPSYNLNLLTEIILLGLMTIFLLFFCLSKGYQDKSLREKLELQFNANRTLKLHVRSLSKYLSPRLSKSIVAGDNVHVEAIDKSLTIFFSDMKGFSQLSEQLNPEQLAWLVNSYLSEMSEIVFRFGGTLDKMIGDSIMVFFGDPNSRGNQTDAVACVCMAMAMREAMGRLRMRWFNAGIQNPPSIRMGINTGNCRVGNFGTETKLDYTVVGSAVNLASHLESIAQPGEILIAEVTYNLVKNHVECTKKNLANPQWLSKELKLYSVQQVADGRNK